MWIHHHFFFLDFLQAPQNAEPPVAPTLNLNDDMISDAPNSDTEFLKEKSTPGEDSTTWLLNQGMKSRKHLIL